MYMLGYTDISIIEDSLYITMIITDNDVNIAELLN